MLARFTDLYGRLLGKRFDAGFFAEQVAEHGTHACDYLLTVDMEMEPVPGYEFANWAKGYGDFVASQTWPRSVSRPGSTARRWCYAT